MEILAVVGGSIGGIAVLGAGAWAWMRTRGKSSRPGDGEGPGERTAPGSPRSAATALKERPAAPTWGDTLTAGREEAPEAEDDEPFDQEHAAPVGVVEPRPGAERVGAAEQPAEGAAPEAAEAPALEEDTRDQDRDPGTGTEPRTAPAVPAVEPAAPSEPVPDQAGARDTTVLLDTPEPAADRMVRLRDRLSRSGALGRGLLGLLTRESVDQDTWDEIEETLLLADLGPDPTDELLEGLRERMRVLGTNDPAAVREVLREELVKIIDPALDRRLAATRREAADGTSIPSVILMVGVNGTGKTTTVGKLARVLVAEKRGVVLGAADTFRAAAADQLATWGSRVGVETIRSDRDGADPAAVAFEAVKQGLEQDADVVIIDTAGRLQNKKGLMDELGKVRRVAEKNLHGSPVAEVLLVLDATTGQNGMQQARVFSEAVDVTGIVLTKLDGTAKGGIVVSVQRELGVPVKMVGLGEGMDDLAPFDPHGFVDALIGD
ncbi:signal recognition particle-docking protein FtsY [Brachybacterium hainanense]|uniref:Signal recognition particle receptor FtsY n=1 Tax=Brachybacterium hainanense TaxID=1541174 RepID=A0ABV6RF13_9MICO